MRIRGVQVRDFWTKFHKVELKTSLKSYLF